MCFEWRKLFKRRVSVLWILEYHTFLMCSLNEPHYEIQVFIHFFPGDFRAQNLGLDRAWDFGFRVLQLLGASGLINYKV